MRNANRKFTIWILGETTDRPGHLCENPPNWPNTSLLKFVGTKKVLLKIADRIFTQCMTDIYPERRAQYLENLARTLAAEFDSVPVDLFNPPPNPQGDLPW